MLPKEQIPDIKKQIVEQIKKTFPADKQAIAVKKLQSMSDEQLEQFLVQNKMIAQGEGDQNQCVFCAITQGQIPSYKIDENKDAIAVLEINPISEAHSLIIPKEHIESADKLPKSAFTLAKKIAKKIKTRYELKEVKIYSENIFGHEIINILPIYENETTASERSKASEEDLKELQKEFEVKKAKKAKPKEEIKKLTKEEIKKLWLPKRIP
jgi:histidine triad (HIT) family protein